MTNDAYLEALDDLAEAVRVHRDVYVANERGLFSWHKGCEETWTKVLGRVRVAGFVSGAGIEMPVVTFTDKE